MDAKWRRPLHNLENSRTAGMRRTGEEITIDKKYTPLRFQLA